MALVPTPVLQTTYGPFQSIYLIQSLLVTLDSMGIYGAFTLKEQFHSLYTRQDANNRLYKAPILQSKRRIACFKEKYM